MKKNSSHKTELESLLQVNKHEGHRQPLSRRDFLAQSAMVSASSFIVPSLTALVSNVIYAQQNGGSLECSLPESNRPAFMVFDMAGGGNIPGANVMVGKAGGQLDFLDNYRRLGLPDNLNPRNNPDMIDQTFGLAFHKDSPFLQGLLMGTSDSTRANCDGFVVASSSDNDTANNPHNPCAWIAKSGTVGSLAPSAGVRNSDTGGNSTGYTNPAFARVVMNNPDNATGLVNPGSLAQAFAQFASQNQNRDQFGSAKALEVAKAIEKLSDRGISNISDADMPGVIKNLTRCGYINVPGTMNKYTPAAVDARLDPKFYAVNTANPNAGLPFGLANNNDDTRRVATLAKLALGGYVGPTTFTRGGFDYHNNNRRDNNGNALSITGDGGTDDRDFFMGLMLGKCLEAAAASGKPLVTYVFTDGGITAGNTEQATRGRANSIVNRFMWTGDCEECSSVFMLAYRPGPTRAQKPMIRNKFLQSRQIGAFKTDGEGRASVDRKFTIVSDNVKQLSMMAVLNYLAALGEEGRLQSVLGENPFSGKEDQFIVFEKLVA